MATLTGPPNPSHLDVEEGEVASGDADIPDSVARALLDALQEKRQGKQLPAAMVPLARVRASQLHQCVANGTDPTEAVIHATLDLIAKGQGPSDPLALADKVFMVRQMPDVQVNVFEGTLVIGLILRSLWGLYKIHETLWFYLVSL